MRKIVQQRKIGLTVVVSKLKDLLVVGETADEVRAMAARSITV